MRNLLLILASALLIFSCNTGNTTIKNSSDSGLPQSDTLRIANDSLEYEILIIEPGFKSWLPSQPARGFYGLNYLENKNRFWVSEYNNRVRDFNRYPRNLYEEEINYDPGTDYGYEVNYLLYNYLLYFQEEYDQKL